MPRNRFLVAAGVTAALAAGGLGAAVLGGGVSGAQTTDAPTTTVAPGAPDDGTTQAPPARGQRGENCPEKDGAGSGTGTSGTPAPTGNISARGRQGNFQRL